jgi:hypothetical protein
MQGERGDAVVTSQSVGKTTCVNATLDQFSRASILSNRLQENGFARFFQLTDAEFNFEIGPGQSIY